MNRPAKPAPAEPQELSRRHALRRALATGLGLAALPVNARETPVQPPAVAREEFVPENDYPFFGAEGLH